MHSSKFLGNQFVIQTPSITVDIFASCGWSCRSSLLANLCSTDLASTSSRFPHHTLCESPKGGTSFAQISYLLCPPVNRWSIVGFYDKAHGESYKCIHGLTFIHALSNSPHIHDLHSISVTAAVGQGEWCSSLYRRRFTDDRYRYCFPALSTL